MKYFTEPQGRFVIKIPTEWQYKNILAGDEEISPFSFELYENPMGAFQISCYSESEKPIPPHVKYQKANTNNLEFVKARNDQDGFNIHLWYAAVEGHLIMAKYIYEVEKSENPELQKDFEKVEKALSTLELLSEDKRKLAIDLNKYENFMASLAASFDLKMKAMENMSLIELLVITGNQIDAFLRMSVVLKKQLINKTNEVDIGLLFQGESDSPIMERKIYKQAKDLGIISQETYENLENLYKERNKVIHRYIISDFKTKYLYDIAFHYEKICEEVRLKLKAIEDEQFSEGVGIYKGKDPNIEHQKEEINLLFSQVNDKHLLETLKRKIDY